MGWTLKNTTSSVFTAVLPSPPRHPELYRFDGIASSSALQAESVLAQSAETGLGNQVVVFEANTAGSGDVAARLQCDDITCLKYIVAVGYEDWEFGVFKSESMTGVVGEWPAFGLFERGGSGFPDRRPAVPGCRRLSAAVIALVQAANWAAAAGEGVPTAIVFVKSQR